MRRPLYSLQRLILSSNRFSNIDQRQDSNVVFEHLKHLSLASNGLGSWTDIDKLSAWCPALESLTLAGNPLVEGIPVRKILRTELSSV